LIKQETIQRIIDTARIEEVVSEFVALKKRGTSMIGLCPFHNEKTPSFHVSPAKGIFKCFGCGKGGDSIGFIMEHEKYSYTEALRHLAQKYNIEIEESAPSAAYLAEQSEKESLLSVTLFAQKFFTHNLLNSDEGKAIGLSYFKERGFTTQTIEKFQLGYAPNQYHLLTNDAVANGYTNEMLVKAGLSAEKDGQVYDRFRERVIFPIHNLTGRVIGFGGRILSSEKSKAKYINSPETEIYHKSQVLYGIWLAKNKIVADDNCFLVEGYTDVISMHQAGITNVVSSSGTSLTTEQIKLIKRFTSNITIIYDGDPAGIKASFRGISMILEEGLNVQVLLLPEPEDPDSFVKKNGLSYVLDFIKQNTTNFILFKTNLLLAEVAHDPVKKANLVTEILTDISLIPNQVTRSFYLKECSSLFSIDEQALNSQLNRMISQKIKKRSTGSSYPVEGPPPEVEGMEAQIMDLPTEPSQAQIYVDYYDCEHQERNIVSLLLNHGNQEIELENKDENNHVIDKAKHQVAKFVISELSTDEIGFEHPLYQKIYNECVVMLNEDENTDIQKHFLQNSNEEIKQLTIEIISFPYEISMNWEESKKISTPNIYDNETGKLNDHVIESIYSLKLRKIELMIHQLEVELRASAYSEERLIEVLTELKDLIDIKNELCKQLHIIITH
jgi:DNA primase